MGKLSFMERIVKTCSIFCLLVLLAACGGTSISGGEPPQVTINSLSKTAAGLNLQLRFRNINQEPMVINRANFTFTLDDHPFKISNSDMQLSLDASTSEVSAFMLALPGEVDSRLSAVESGEVASLQHELKGEVFDQQGNNLKFSFKGHIYAVPGRPGQFR